ncbi:MAG: hypothetical protein IJV26_00060 [Lachnospiraceae bacterium]|nr:hypothetical protein [Lachnospiraceae bacterium]
MSSENRIQQNMSEEEMLAELLRVQQRDEKIRRIFTILSITACVLVILSVLILVPSFLHVLGNANQLMLNANQVVEKSLSTLSNADAAATTLNQTVGELQTFMNENSGNASGTLETISQLDIETLNQSITELSQIVGPLARMMSAFQ